MKTKVLNVLIWSAAIILFVVASYFILSTSSLVRYWADDFCSSVLLRNNGFLNSQIVWWNGWTGRYSATFFISLSEMLGQNFATILPIVLFVLFTISLYTMFSVLPALILAVILILLSPNIIQSFYWMTGSLNYFAPFIFLNFYLALVFSKGKKYTNLVAFILLFLAAGFSESFAVATFVFLVFLLLVLRGYKKEKILVIGLLTTAISLVIMYLAPGNAVRSATVSHPDGILDLINKTFIYSKWYLTHLLYIKEFVLSVLTIIIGAFVVLDKNKKYFENPKKVLVYSAIFIVGITFVVVGLTYQAMNWEPPMRVMTIVNYMIIYSVIIAAVALFQIFRKYIPSILSKMLFLILVIALIFQVNKQWGSVQNELKTYAVAWDMIEKRLVDAPDGSIVEVPELKPVGKLDGFVENKGWVSSCIAGYYNLEKLEYE